LPTHLPSLNIRRLKDAKPAVGSVLLDTIEYAQLQSPLEIKFDFIIVIMATATPSEANSTASLEGTRNLAEWTALFKEELKSDVEMPTAVGAIRTLIEFIKQSDGK
jgi:hypothetical protein